MGISAVSGKDVLVLDGQVISALADGDAIKLDFDGPIAQMKVSKDGNSIYALQYSGITAKLTLRLVRGSFDDAELNSKLQQWIADPATFPLLSGSYTKRIGDGKGNVTSEIYQLSGGIFERIPAAMSNMEGNTEQSVTIYNLMFRNDARLTQ